MDKNVVAIRPAENRSVTIVFEGPPGQFSELTTDNPTAIGNYILDTKFRQYEFLNMDSEDPE